MPVATKRFVGSAIALGLVLLLSAIPAAAQYGSNPQDLQTRIDRLERELQDLQRYTYQGPPAPTAGPSGSGSYTSTVRADDANLPATAVLSRRVDEMEFAVRDMTGEVERLTFRINQLSEQFERVMGDVDYRLRALEGNLAPGETAPLAGTVPGGSTRPLAAAPLNSPASSDILGVEADMTEYAGPPAMAGASQPQLLGSISASRLSGTEDADFEIGMQLLRQGDFADAQNTFQEFIGAYPNSARLGEAYFWLGESLFVRGAYNEAATAYLTSARDYGGEVKAPDSLLKLGMSLAALGQTTEACSAFDQVARAYPNASDRVTRNVARERASNNCR